MFQNTFIRNVTINIYDNSVLNIDLYYNIVHNSIVNISYKCHMF